MFARMYVSVSALAKFSIVTGSAYATSGVISTSGGNNLSINVSPFCSAVVQLRKSNLRQEFLVVVDTSVPCSSTRHDQQTVRATAATASNLNYVYLIYRVSGRFIDPRQ